MSTFDWRNQPKETAIKGKDAAALKRDATRKNREYLACKSRTPEETQKMERARI